MKAHMPCKTPAQAANNIIRRYIKLSIIALHQKFGFGHDRVADFLGEINKLSDEREKDEIFWTHVDHVIKNELGIDFPDENYEEMDK